MPQRFLDHTGIRYGMLVGVRRASLSLPNTKWVWRCDCGNEKIMDARNVKFRSSSCGCKQGGVIHGEIAGRKMTSEYGTWLAMRQRCKNLKNAQFRNYGGRGIKVCPRWDRDFANFLADMGRRPSPTHSLDRINNNGHYEPKNCRWATPHQQQVNTRKRRVYEIDGKRGTILEHHLRLRTKVKLTTVLTRIYSGWDAERALKTPKISPIEAARRGGKASH